MRHVNTLVLEGLIRNRIAVAEIPEYGKSITFALNVRTDNGRTIVPVIADEEKFGHLTGLTRHTKLRVQGELGNSDHYKNFKMVVKASTIEYNIPQDENTVSETDNPMEENGNPDDTLFPDGI